MESGKEGDKKDHKDCGWHGHCCHCARALAGFILLLIGLTIGYFFGRCSSRSACGMGYSKMMNPHMMMYCPPESPAADASGEPGQAPKKSK